jgi:acetylornithine/N-succinyldiaminopimelate aminotransferase
MRPEPLYCHAGQTYTKPMAAIFPQSHGEPVTHDEDASAALTTGELVQLGAENLLGNYRQAPMVLVRGSGCVVTDSDGRRYLDFAAGVAVNALGHAHPKLVAAIADQAATLMHVSNYFYNDQNVLLADELCRASGFARAFFCNSGAEANEAMLKLARRWAFNAGKRDKIRFVAFDTAFHGRTFATVNLTGTPSYREGFGPFQSVTHVPYGDLAAAEAAMGDDVCGVFVEPVQGEGGVLPAPAGFLRGLRELCDRHDALLLVDEVQTGVGRTGTFLGWEQSGVRPDAVSMAKGLGGGFPIGALLVSDRLTNVLTPGTHGSTFGGNALASRAARVVLEVLTRDRLMDSVRSRGEHLSRRLTELAERFRELCEGERGLGLMRGLVLKKGVDAREALTLAREHGVLLTIAGGQVLRFTPPLVVSDAEIDEAVDRLAAALSALRLRMITPG